MDTLRLHISLTIRAVAVVLHIHACIAGESIEVQLHGTHAASASRHTHFGCTAVIHESDVCHWRVRECFFFFLFVS